MLFQLIMPLLALTGNAGSFGKNDVNGQVCPVLKNICNLQYCIKGMCGRFPDIMGWSETMNDKVFLAPGFKLPITVDDQ